MEIIKKAVHLTSKYKEEREQLAELNAIININSIMIQNAKSEIIGSSIQRNTIISKILLENGYTININDKVIYKEQEKTIKVFSTCGGFDNGATIFEDFK